MKLTVVSPTYNEAANIARLSQEVHAALSGMDYELLIVDDDSPDQTWAVAHELAKRNKHIRVLRRTKGRGLSAAVIEGIHSSMAEYVAVIDADLQHNPEILPKMVEALDAGAEIAVGSRYVEGGGIGAWGTGRRLQSWIATKLAGMFLGVKLRDPMSGFFMLRRADFGQIEKSLDASGFKILLEIVARLVPSKLREVPYTFRMRTAGQSKLSSKIVLQYLGQLWRLSSVSGYMSVRFIKFGLVGASGTIVNLGAFLALARFLSAHDWRISALATLIANLTNYLLNNIWTFVDRMHRGWEIARGYFSYLTLSLVGMLASTLTFATLGFASRDFLQSLRSATEIYGITMAFQFAAIAVGTVFNYELNKKFTWNDGLLRGTVVSNQECAQTLHKGEAA